MISVLAIGLILCGLSPPVSPHPHDKVLTISRHLPAPTMAPVLEPAEVAETQDIAVEPIIGFIGHPLRSVDADFAIIRRPGARRPRDGL